MIIPAAADPVFIIAELSGNHGGSKQRAIDLIHAAKAAGADAVKLQTYTADTITMDAPGPWFAISGGPWDGRRLHELYQEASTPWEWHADLFAAAAACGLPCFSSPFDPTAVAFLEGLAVPGYKVASFEVIDLPLLTCIAATRKPVIMSTGMASVEEISEALATLRDGGCPQVALLACVSAYPAKPSDFRLRKLAEMQRRFGCIVGLSDHSLTPTACIAAVALGARIIEKHLTLRRDDGGPDAGFSLEPAEFRELVIAVRDAESALAGEPDFGAGQAESGNVQFRKSLFAGRDIAAGTVVTAADVRCIRPGHGLMPRELGLVIGSRARVPIVRGTPLSWELLSRGG
jgi:N-acetylneuraminate synthase